MLRLILIPISIVLLLLVAAVILVPVLLDKEELLELASEVLYEETGATLSVDGDIGLSLFPTVGISLADAGLTMAGSEQPDLQAHSMEIGVQFIPLLFGNVQINTIRLDGMTARIESAPEQEAVDSGKLSDEQLDAFYAARRKAMREADDAAGAELALAVPLALEVKHLVITDSRLELMDPTTQSGWRPPASTWTESPFPWSCNCAFPVNKSLMWPWTAISASTSRRR
jgi:AsmA protein